jgi:hypothetical protein
LPWGRKGGFTWHTLNLDLFATATLVVGEFHRAIGVYDPINRGRRGHGERGEYEDKYQ